MQRGDLGEHALVADGEHHRLTMDLLGFRADVHSLGVGRVEVGIDVEDDIVEESCS